MMKYCISLVALLLLLSVKAEAQCEADTLVSIMAVENEALPADSVSMMVTPVAPFDYKNTPYWSRNKAKNFAATSTLAVGGVTLMFYSFIKMWVEGESLGWADYVLGGGGGLLVASSIPLYISAAKDRKLAKQSADSYVPKRDYRYSGFRYEVSAGMTFPTDTRGENGKLGTCFGVEGRTFIGDSDFDVAAKFSYEQIVSSGYYNNNNVERILRLTAFADYNLCKGEVVNPYVGMGLGTSLETVHVEPRIGVELWRRHRVALQWRKALFSTESPLTKHDNLSLTYGYSF